MIEWIGEQRRRLWVAETTTLLLGSWAWQLCRPNVKLALYIWLWISRRFTASCHHSTHGILAMFVIYSIWGRKVRLLRNNVSDNSLMLSGMVRVSRLNQHCLIVFIHWIPQCDWYLFSNCYLSRFAQWRNDLGWCPWARKVWGPLCPYPPSPEAVVRGCYSSFRQFF